METLRRKRGAIKSKLTHLKNAVTDLLKPDTEKLDSITINSLKLRLSNCDNDIFRPYNLIQDEIEVQCKEEEVIKEYEERNRFEDEYYKIVATINDLIEKSEEPDNGSVRGNLVGQPVVENISNNNDSLKLPTIHLPKFKGDYTSWLEFKDIYVSLIHSNNNITAIMKFHYLRASLEGSAMQVIKSMEFSAINYETAWELLCNRYDNNHLLVHNHIKALFDIQIIQRESATEFRKVVDDVSKHLRALEIIQEKSETFDAIIIYVLLGKLDFKTAREWEEKNMVIQLRISKNI